MSIGSINPTNGLTQQFAYTKGETSMKSFEDALGQAVMNEDEKALKEACVQVEQYMVSQIFKQMKHSLESEDPLIPKGDYEKMVEDYVIDAQCKTLCESGGIGLSDMMYKQMLNEL